MRKARIGDRSRKLYRTGTQRSNVAIPEDTFLSGVHFALEWRGLQCWVIDNKSANGTFVNGEDN